MPSKRRSARRTGKGLDKREITLPGRDYQPTKAETEREYDMPGADIVTVRSARESERGKNQGRLAASDVTIRHNSLLKGALKSAPRPRSATTSVIAGPVGSPSREDVV